MTLDELDQALDNLSRRTEISIYALRRDSELIKLLVNDATKAEVMEWLQGEYPDYFEAAA